MRAALCLAVVGVLCVAPGFAQEGNGAGNAYVDPTPAILGETMVINFGAPGVPFVGGLLTASPGLGPTMIGGAFGTLWVDLFNPATIHVPVAADITGNGSIALPLAGPAAMVNLPPLYYYIALYDPSLPFPSLSITKTIRLEFENADSYKPTESGMLEPRADATSTSTSRFPGDPRTRVLVAGGGNGDLLTPTATSTTEVYLPVTRQFSPGPAMSQARIVHRSVRLLSGHILVTGGLSGAGAATASCELFDPTNETFFPTGSMNVARAGHRLTLLGDGRVLCTGGITDYTNAASSLSGPLATAQSTAEIYDPATGSWMAISNMSSARVGHTHTVLNDGTVFIGGGLTGAQFDLWTGAESLVMSSVSEVFDPATDTFTAVGSIFGSFGGARAFHGESLLADGRVLFTGGLSSGAPTFGLSTCEVWDPTTLVWTAVGGLAAPVAFHSQVAAPDGTAIIVGGLTGDMNFPAASSLSGRHNGTFFIAGNPVGENPGMLEAAPSPRGRHRLTRIFDGSYIVVGGSTGNNAALADAMVFID